ncbi:hypothetical protein [Crocosphaera sp.]|uniref:hypothetical protein n=1 Tax=Crocosphaera sp. TaxID=2729996 RepID=UPI002617800A|nr:hypothetical protein [Crocosphaera sp.]MDJ0579102.1 hypothetical protein [Crocosphaera sp.]
MKKPLNIIVFLIVLYSLSVPAIAIASPGKNSIDTLSLVIAFVGVVVALVAALGAAIYTFFKELEKNRKELDFKLQKLEDELTVKIKTIEKVSEQLALKNRASAEAYEYLKKVVEDNKEGVRDLMRKQEIGQRQHERLKNIKDFEEKKC